MEPSPQAPEDTKKLATIARQRAQSMAASADIPTLLADSEAAALVNS
ncbi:MAG: hypothetical protein H7242_10215 [Microbacteriaceae bacterium]|nr:hypothetical protein [Burkholderiaceae bacterium]